MRPKINTGVARTILLTAVVIFAIAASPAAAQGRGGVRGSGRGGPHPHFATGHTPFHGPQGRVVIRGGFRDPFFWGSYPYWGWGDPYPYDVYPFAPTTSGDVKTEVTPKQTEIYVDGYYAGVADNFDGAFTRLHTSPGGHAFTLHLEGYRTVTQNVYVRPDSTYKLTETMEKLAPGEVTAPVPLPTARPDDTTTAPDGGSALHR